jgi:hypothetical protein
MRSLRGVPITAWAAVIPLACVSLRRLVGVVLQTQALLQGPSAELSPVQIVESVRTDPPLDVLTFVSFALSLATVVTFLVWVASAFRRAESVGAKPRRTAPTVIIGFFTPVLCFFWPYIGMRALDEAIEPELVPEPPPRPSDDAPAGGYRQAAVEKRPARTHAPRAPFGLWWALWVGPMVVDFVWMLTRPHAWWTDHLVPMVSGLVTDLDAVLAVLVILRIEARLAERARRVT